ncbi:MAG: hypothetical protein IIB38_15405 [Candidatus Hydrogenedentes bacterium]|nr:hypothetical protein [Candidatus Hydrogenedentota bacterium]
MHEQRPPISSSQPNKGLSGVIKFVIVASIGIVFLMSALIAFVFYVGVAGPEIEVLAGTQVPTRYVDTIRNLGVLDRDEEIIFFYSDALVDITDGFYLLTDRKVVVYSTTYSEPAILIPFDDIQELNIEYDESFFTDSAIWITRTDGSAVSFPVSSEAGGDKRFYEALVERKERAVGSGR